MKKPINLSRLPPARKRKAWEWIKQNRPDHAAFIETLTAKFGGEVIFQDKGEQCKD